MWPTPLHRHCSCRSSHSLLGNPASHCCPLHSSQRRGEVLRVSEEVLKHEDEGNANLGQEGVPSGGELQKLGTPRSLFYQEMNRLNTGSESTYQVYLAGMFTFYWPSPLHSHPHSLPGARWRLHKYFLRDEFGSAHTGLEQAARLTGFFTLKLYIILCLNFTLIHIVLLNIVCNFFKKVAFH